MVVVLSPFLKARNAVLHLLPVMGLDYAHISGRTMTCIRLTSLQNTISREQNYHCCTQEFSKHGTSCVLVKGLLFVLRPVSNRLFWHIVQSCSISCAGDKACREAPPQTCGPPPRTAQSQSCRVGTNPGQQPTSRKEVVHLQKLPAGSC